jgi:hypothetical protein
MVRSWRAQIAVPITGPWSKLADIIVAATDGSNGSYARLLPSVEGPSLFADRRGSFHIIDHRCVRTGVDRCYGSTISARSL